MASRLSCLTRAINILFLNLQTRTHVCCCCVGPEPGPEPGDEPEPGGGEQSVLRRRCASKICGDQRAVCCCCRARARVEVGTRPFVEVQLSRLLRLLRQVSRPSLSWMSQLLEDAAAATWKDLASTAPEEKMKERQASPVGRLDSNFHCNNDRPVVWQLGRPGNPAGQGGRCLSSVD